MSEDRTMDKSDSAPAALPFEAFRQDLLNLRYSLSTVSTHLLACSHCRIADGSALYNCPCGAARYCSTTCQLSHWPYHRAQCGHGVRRSPYRRCHYCHKLSTSLRLSPCALSYYCDYFCQKRDWPQHRLLGCPHSAFCITVSDVEVPLTRAVSTQTERKPGILYASAYVAPDNDVDAAKVVLTNKQQGGDFQTSTAPQTSLLTRGGQPPAAPFIQSRKERPFFWVGEEPQRCPSQVISEETGSNPLADNRSSLSETRVRDAYRLQRLESVQSDAGSFIPRAQSVRSTPGMPRLNDTYASFFPPFYQQPRFSVLHDSGDDGAGGGGGMIMMMNSGSDGAQTRVMTASSKLGDGEDRPPHSESSSAAAASGAAGREAMPSLMALVVASRRYVAEEEHKERTVLLTAFTLQSISIALRDVVRMESEARLRVLASEVLHCMQVCHPAWLAWKGSLLSVSGSR